MEIILLLVVAAMFTVPLIGVVAFVAFLTAHRQGAVKGPWGELAQRFGGRLYDGPKVLVDRGSHQLSVTLDVVSQFQSLGGHYPRGGTFTVVRLAFDPAGPHQTGLARQRLTPSRLASATGVAALTMLPEDTYLTVDVREVRVVLDGAVSDLRTLSPTMDALRALGDQIASRPMAAFRSQMA